MPVLWSVFSASERRVNGAERAGLWLPLSLLHPPHIHVSVRFQIRFQLAERFYGFKKSSNDCLRIRINRVVEGYLWEVKLSDIVSFMIFLMLAVDQILKLFVAEINSVLFVDKTVRKDFDVISRCLFLAYA